LTVTFGTVLAVAVAVGVEVAAVDGLLVGGCVVRETVTGGVDEFAVGFLFDPVAATAMTATTPRTTRAPAAARPTDKMKDAGDSGACLPGTIRYSGIPKRRAAR
jgi:hypothetical protein